MANDTMRYSLDPPKGWQVEYDAAEHVYNLINGEEKLIVSEHPIRGRLRTTTRGEWAAIVGVINWCQIRLEAARRTAELSH